MNTPTKTRTNEEYDEDSEEEGDDEPLEIKVRTPQSETPPETEPSEAEESPAAVVPAAQAAGVGSRIAQALRIKKPKKAATAPAKSEPAPRQQVISEREQIIEELDAAAETPVDEEADYELPPLDLLLPAENVSYEEHAREVRRKAKILERTFANFGFRVKVVEIETGPVIAQYEVELEAGLRLSKITGLADDLAIALRVPSVRIVAPIPGKNTVGIEVPNENRQLVRLREVIEETNGRAKRMKIPIYLGKDVSGNPLVVDLTSLPHLLIAGRTGTGKSVCLNSIILSMLMGRGPDEVRLLLIDPKMVELSQYKKLPHLMHPVVTDMRKAEAILAWAVEKMEERYAMLARAGVRHVSVYNQLSESELRDRVQPESDEEWQQIPRQLPFIVIVADEMADLMMTAGKDVEQHIIRLAQKSRAVGIHLILATQKPTVDVITGLIKSNLPARIAFQVASRTDSRVVLDEMGADKLLGNGDMLFLSPGTSMLLRGQGTYLSDDEITRVVDFVGTDDQKFVNELVQLKAADEEESGKPGALKNRDELYEAAIDVVVREQRGSVSLLQRTLGIGYGRAARLIDFMAEDGFVGEYNGSQAREVLLTLSDWETLSGGGGEPPPDPPSPPRPNRIRMDSDSGAPPAKKKRRTKRGKATVARESATQAGDEVALALVTTDAPRQTAAGVQMLAPWEGGAVADSLEGIEARTIDEAIEDELAADADDALRLAATSEVDHRDEADETQEQVSGTEMEDNELENVTEELDDELDESDGESEDDEEAEEYGDDDEEDEYEEDESEEDEYEEDECEEERRR